MFDCTAGEILPKILSYQSLPYFSMKRFKIVRWKRGTFLKIQCEFRKLCIKFSQNKSITMCIKQTVSITKHTRVYSYQKMTINFLSPLRGCKIL